ncbi:ubiquitin-protein transferase activating protein, partial [Rhizophlyctis rosea]
MTTLLRNSPRSTASSRFLLHPHNNNNITQSPTAKPVGPAGVTDASPRKSSFASSPKKGFGMMNTASATAGSGMRASPAAGRSRFSVLGKSNLEERERKMLRVVSPSKHGRVKVKQYDRFIPTTEAMERAVLNYKVQDQTSSQPQRYLDEKSLLHQEKLAKACGVALGQRILAFTADPPHPTHEDFRSTWNRPLRRPDAHVARRVIKTAPERVLDAPGMSDDYYLNLLDWSVGNLMAVALDDTVWVWNAETGTAEELYKTPTDTFSYISSVQFTPDGNFLAVGLSEGDIQLWNLQTMSKTRTMRGRATRVGVLSCDRHIVSSGGRDGAIWHHDVRSANHKVAELAFHESDVCGLKWRVDGGALASGGNDNMVAVWDVRSSRPRFTKGEHLAAVKALAWCPWHLTTLATGGGSHDKRVHFWNTTTEGRTGTVQTDSQVTSIIWSNTYKEFLTSHGYPECNLSIWKYPSGKKVGDLEGHEGRVLHSA